MRSGNPFVIGLVVEEVGRLVDQAMAADGKVSVEQCAERLRARYPSIEIVHDRLLEEIRLATEARGTAVQIDGIGPESC